MIILCVVLSILVVFLVTQLLQGQHKGIVGKINQTMLIGKIQKYMYVAKMGIKALTDEQG